MSGNITKFFTKTAVSAARSLILSEVKGSVKSFLNKKRAKTIDEVHKEMMQTIGYITSHYTINKAQEIIYKSSGPFCHEFLTTSPLITEKILRDEESGHIYVDNELITNSKKLDFINRFIKATNIKNPSLNSHMESGFKLIDFSDANAQKFKKHFDGWNPENKSIIDQWLVNVFGDTLNTDLTYANFLFRKWIIGCAQRAITPGSTLDGCLTLSGASGVGKTAFFRNLLPPPFNNRTGEIYCNIKNPVKFVENIKGKTIACFDELSVLDNVASEETFKQLLSSQFIDVRLPWAREPQRYALRSGFCATTNKETKFIPNEFFSRRLWVIQLNKGRINFDYLFANRAELWKEAVYLALKNEEHCILQKNEQLQVEEKNQTYLL